VPRIDYKTCRQCERHASECGPLSHTRLCADCGLANQTHAIIEQAEHYGTTLLLWRRGVAASVGAVLLDDVQTNP